MSWRPHPKWAATDASSPRGWATSDRSGFIGNLENMRFQYAWSGPQLINTRLQVYEAEYDVPNEQFRTLIIPPDPPSLMNARPEPYTIDETDWRVTQDGSIRSTQDGNLRVVQSSETEAESEGTN